MSNDAVYGHEKEIAILKSAIRKNRVAHAYLFHGMEGIGKRTVAMAFAKAVLCAGPEEDGGACGHCPSCLKVDHGNHPDVITVEPDGAFIKLQAVRDMMNAMAFRPLEGDKRFFIVVDADRLNATAANALLKTLEEPSPSNVLVLVTARPHQLPATILSRCQNLRFNPLAQEEVSRFLRERLSLEPDECQALAAACGGSIEWAMRLREGDYVNIRKEVMDYLAGTRVMSPLDRLFFIQFIGRDKKNLTEKLDVLKTCFRDALVYRELGNSDGLINFDREDTIRAMAERTSAQDMIENLRIMDRLTRALEQNANKALTLEAALFKVVY